MITNDKFCLTRWSELRLSWWRRPATARHALIDSGRSILPSVKRTITPSEEAMQSNWQVSRSRVARPQRWSTTLGLRLPVPSAVGDGDSAGVNLHHHTFRRMEHGSRIVRSCFDRAANNRRRRLSSSWPPAGAGGASSRSGTWPTSTSTAMMATAGPTLNRPGLDRLRDHAALGAFELVLITAPDRLARKYVHQVLLIEELQARAVASSFWNGR